MRAVRLLAPREALQFVDIPSPEPFGTEVLVRVAACGVCHTDLHIVDGSQARVDLPLTLGHEVSGWVDAIGPDAEAPLREAGMAVGDPVLVYGGWGCGTCRDCAAGHEQRCPDGRSPGFQADGGYAELMLVPHPRHLVALGTLDPVEAAPLADAGLTPYRAVRRARPWLVSGARVLVIGGGGLGQFAVQYLRIVPEAGPTLVIAVSEPSSARRERATELGADLVLPELDGLEPAGRLGGPADVVLDFVGSDETLAQAAAVIAPGGLTILVGEAGGRLSFSFEQPAVEAWLTTTAWGSVDELRRVVDLANQGALRWSVDRMGLADASAAHDRLRAGDVVGRLVVVPA